MQHTTLPGRDTTRRTGHGGQLSWRQVLLLHSKIVQQLPTVSLPCLGQTRETTVRIVESAGGGIHARRTNDCRIRSDYSYRTSGKPRRRFNCSRLEARFEAQPNERACGNTEHLSVSCTSIRKGRLIYSTPNDLASGQPDELETRTAP
jgi:hypothetical protein